jgi:prevent-host-death family protein
LVPELDPLVFIVPGDSARNGEASELYTGNPRTPGGRPMARAGRSSRKERRPYRLNPWTLGLRHCAIIRWHKKRGAVESFNIRDLRERTGELVRNAEQGKLAVIAKHGHPLFVAVPLDEALLRSGVGVALAIRLFQDGTISLGKAAKLSGLSSEAFVEQLASLGIAAVDYSPDEVDGELAAIG